MRRWVWRIAVCVALGAATTVVVAWACWLNGIRPDVLGLPRQSYIIERPRTAGYGSGHLFRMFGYASFYFGWGTSSEVRVTLDRKRVEFEPAWGSSWLIPAFNSYSGDANTVTVAGAGWPSICLGGVWGGDRGAITCVPAIQLHKLLNTRIGLSSVQLCLPLRPVYAGLLINTLFYALLWFALLACVPRLLRAIRRRRGRCPTCAYDLRGLSAARCPECGGATIPSSSCTTPPSQPA